MLTEDLSPGLQHAAKSPLSLSTTKKLPPDRATTNTQKALLYNHQCYLTVWHIPPQRLHPAPEKALPGPATPGAIASRQKRRQAGKGLGYRVGLPFAKRMRFKNLFLGPPYLRAQLGVKRSSNAEPKRKSKGTKKEPPCPATGISQKCPTPYPPRNKHPTPRPAPPVPAGSPNSENSRGNIPASAIQPFGHSS